MSVSREYRSSHDKINAYVVAETTWKCSGIALLLTGGRIGDRGSTVVKVLCYKSEGHWFVPSLCQWIFR